MSRVLMLSLGYGFLVLGVLGLFLPFLQGFLFIFVGLLILARHAPWAERMLDRIRKSHPKMGSMIDQAEGMADRWSERCRNGWRSLWRRGATAEPEKARATLPDPHRPSTRHPSRDDANIP